MTQIELKLYEGIPDSELPEDIRRRRRQTLEAEAVEAGKPVEAPPDLTAGEFSDRELKSPLSTAYNYARAVKQEAETEKGAHDNKDYARAIIIIVASMIAVCLFFGVVVGGMMTYLGNVFK